MTADPSRRLPPHPTPGWKSWNRWGLSAALGLLAAGGGVFAEEGAAGDAPPEPVGPWTWKGSIGAFLSSTEVNNGETSRDASIAGTSDTVNWRLKFDGELDWSEGIWEVNQKLRLRYGRQKQDDESWEENSDQIDYDGVLEYKFQEPQYIYGAWGLDSVFTGVEPDEEPFDPATVKISAGYGQKRFFEEKKYMLEARVGVRAQRKFGRGLSDEEREVEIGPEGYLRHEGQPEEYVSYWLQYEIFSEFEDLGHISHLLTAGLEIRVVKYVRVDFDWRAFYESRPDDVDEDAPGYDELSWMQEALIGLTYDF